jgi:hypothetical protein
MQDGENWLHIDEYRVLDTQLRRLVGASERRRLS